MTAGTAALDCGRIVWPTMILAGQLDQALAWRFPGATAATDYRARSSTRARASRCQLRAASRARTADER